jgi:hypothetical protein
LFDETQNLAVVIESFSFTDGAMNGLPSCRRISVSISLARRLSRLKTRSPANDIVTSENLLSVSHGIRGSELAREACLNFLCGGPLIFL